MKATLSLDLDNCLRDQIGAIIEAVKRRNAGSLTREMFAPWDPHLGQHVGMDNDQFTKWVWNDPMIVANARPMPGVVRALTRLHRQYRLIITTATAHPQLTEPWLKWWGIPYDAVVHTKDKVSVSFAWHVDDSPAILQELHEAGRGVIRFALPWNETLSFLPSLSTWRCVGLNGCSLKELVNW